MRVEHAQRSMYKRTVPPEPCLQRDYFDCGQQRHRPACASAYSGQRYCLFFFGGGGGGGIVMNALATHKIYHILASLCSLADWFESYFVGNTKDKFSRVRPI